MDQPNKEHNEQPKHDYGHWGHHGHHLLRWLLGLVILAIVFCLGVKIGRFSAMFGGYHHGGYGASGHHGYRMMEDYYPPMLYQNKMAPPAPQTMPAQPVPAAPQSPK